MTQIYLDEQATTPLGTEAAAAMRLWAQAGAVGNPHSANAHGLAAHAVVERARAQVAAALDTAPATIRWTSGATEANNWALFGTLARPGQTRRRIVTIATEHSAVLEPARALARLGAELSLLPVGPDGLVRLDDVRAAVGPDVALVSAMLVNNEIGVIQPIAEIAAIARAAGAVMHCDAAQAFGKLPCRPAALGIDLMSLSAHKLHGPQGIGALYVAPGVEIAPWLHGGGQEPGRSGTVPVALAAGFGAAASAAARLDESRAHVEALWDAALARLSVPYVINGSAERRWRGNLNLRFPGVDGARLLSALLRNVSLSSGAACAAAAGRDSHVLAALGLSRAEARASLRLGWGRFTTRDDVEAAVDAINTATRAAARKAA